MHRAIALILLILSWPAASSALDSLPRKGGMMLQIELGRGWSVDSRIDGFDDGLYLGGRYVVMGGRDHGFGFAFQHARFPREGEGIWDDPMSITDLLLQIHLCFIDEHPWELAFDAGPGFSIITRHYRLRPLDESTVAHRITDTEIQLGLQFGMNLTYRGWSNLWAPGFFAGYSYRDWHPYVVMGVGLSFRGD